MVASSSGKSEDDIIKQPETYVVNSIGAADEEQEVIEDEGSDAVNSIGAADEEQEVIEDEGSDAVNSIDTADEEQEVIKNETSEIVYNAEEAAYAKPEVEDVHNGKPEMDVTYSADAVDVEQEETENKGSDVVNSIDSVDEEQEEAAFTKPKVENVHSGKPEMEVPYSDEEADKKQEDTDKPVTEVVYKIVSHKSKRFYILSTAFCYGKCFFTGKVDERNRITLSVLAVFRPCKITVGF